MKKTRAQKIIEKLEVSEKVKNFSIEYSPEYSEKMKKIKEEIDKKLRASSIIIKGKICD